MTEQMSQQARADRECLMQLSSKAFLTDQRFGTHWDHRYLADVLMRAAERTLQYQSLETRLEAKLSSPAPFSCSKFHPEIHYGTVGEISACPLCAEKHRTFLMEVDLEDLRRITLPEMHQENLALKDEVARLKSELVG